MIVTERESKNAKRAAAMRETRKLWDAENKCRACGSTNKSEDNLRCDACIEKDKTRMLARYYIRKEKGLCTKCGKNVAVNNSYCETCNFKHLARMHLNDTSKWIVLKQLWDQQSGKDYYTGKQLKFGNNASLDHVKPQSRFPEQQTEITNLRWTHGTINSMKHNYTEQEFANLISIMYVHQNIKEELDIELANRL